MNKWDEIHNKAVDIWIKSGFKATECIATGVGKSKIGIMCIEYYKDCFNNIHKRDPKVLIVVPTEVLRDNNWIDEFIKWNKSDLLKITNLECYASLHKLTDCYDLVILDEVHHLTPLSYSYFQLCQPMILGLTATAPEDLIKLDIINKLCPIKFNYPLDQAVKDGIVNPFKIKIVEFNLDNTTKNIVAGTKLNPFMTTEQGQYDYLTKNITRMRFSTSPSAKQLEQFAILNRMRFIYNLPSKTVIARKILNNKIKNDKSLIFCGSIAQADDLCKDRFHSKTSKKAYNDFCSNKIKKLAVVNAANEGSNFPLVDSGLIVQLNSKQLTLIQRLGRLLRLRPNHEAICWIICCLNTQDEVWCKNAIEGIDPSRIEYINVKNL